MRVACLQINATENVERNLSTIEKHLSAARRLSVELAALPENALWRGPSSQLAEMAAVSSKLVAVFAAWAKKYKTAILLGSLIERNRGDSRFVNVSYLYNREGRIAGRYEKIHLFDIGIKGRLEVRESTHIRPGKRLVCARLGNIKAGLSICYDLRFPELYRGLASMGAQLIFVPANFTFETGKAHWDLLLRARAVENQAFVIAPAQVGRHPGNHILSFGRSLIVDPWGRVLARGDGRSEGVVWADLDLAAQRRIRKEFPVLKHRRLACR